MIAMKQPSGPFENPAGRVLLPIIPIFLHPVQADSHEFRTLPPAQAAENDALEADISAL